MTTEEWSDEILALQSIYEEIDVLSDKCIEINFKDWVFIVFYGL